MLYEKTTEVTETESFKPVKRVRFSDEVQKVFEFNENSENISLEIKGNTASVESIILEQSELFIEELSDIGNVNNKSFPDNINEVSEISSYDEVINGSDTLYEECQNIESTVKYALSTFNSVSDANSLNELIINTKLMSISPTETTESEDNLMSSKELRTFKLSSHISSSEKASEKNMLHTAVEHFDQKSVTVLSHKRPLKEMQIEKQTSKLNNCLRKNNSEIKSADELKTAVFNAWYEVKKQKTVLNVPCIPEVKKINETSQKNSSNIAFETWKTSKKKTKKMKIPEPVSQKTKEDLEESKMVFRAWKKKKDELLKHQIAEKYRKEEKKRLDALMNEKIRKNDAESAYSAWNAHKAVVSKMERKKNQWFLEKENEKLQEKMKKNDVAAEVYYEWLMNKIYFSKANTYKVVRDNPPWTPPGKANSLI